MVLRIVLLALATALAAAAPAAAAEVTVRVTPSAGVRLGDALAVGGRVTEAGAPLADRVVELEVRRFPYRRAWVRHSSARTGADGRYSFAPELDRNHRVRVRLLGVLPAGPYPLPEPDTLSRVREAYVLPAFTLRFRQLMGRRIRLIQRYRVPRDVRLSARTRFYVGPSGAARARLRARARTRRVRAGRYVAKATVRIPVAFGGRFSYVSCFPYSEGSGMGDPDLRCPRRFVRLR